MRSDDYSSDNDREGIREIPHHPRQSYTVPQMRHRRRESNDSQCGPVETEYRRGHHFPSSGRESNHETNEQECDEVSDVNASGCEEHIRAEVMLVDVVPLKHRKYSRL